MDFLAMQGLNVITSAENESTCTLLYQDEGGKTAKANLQMNNKATNLLPSCQVLLQGTALHLSCKSLGKHLLDIPILQCGVCHGVCGVSCYSPSPPASSQMQPLFSQQLVSQLHLTCTSGFICAGLMKHPQQLRTWSRRTASEGWEAADQPSLTGVLWGVSGGPLRSRWERSPLLN